MQSDRDHSYEIHFPISYISIYMHLQFNTFMETKPLIIALIFKEIT